jgi:hypothetical protein
MDLTNWTPVEHERQTSVGGSDPVKKRALLHSSSGWADAHPELATEQVVSAVDEALASFGAASIRDYVPLVVERRARRLLVSSNPTDRA